MALDPYSQCPCGSGKKFKWCCQPIYAGIEKAFKQHQDNQPQAALSTMEEVVAANAGNPEVYGRYAMLLYDLGRAEDADAAIDKAFAINPKYPFGHYLRGQFRMAEGEVNGALLLFRKAAEYYDPEARQQVAALYARIAETELRANRPVASRAALQMAMRNEPGQTEYQEAMNAVFGKESHLPGSARTEYVYKSLRADAPADKKKNWEQALSQQVTGKLEDAKKAFEQLTQADSTDAAAWYNLALTNAWLGDNGGALEVLDEYVQRESDDAQVTAAWALAEVLRCGDGMESSEADYVSYNRTYQIVNGEKLSQAITKLDQENRLVASQVTEQDQVFTSILVEAPTVLIAGAAPAEAPRFAAHVLLMANVLRVWSTNKDGLDKVALELEQLIGDGIGQKREDVGPAQFTDLLSEALVFPIVADESEQEQAREKIRQGMQEFFEEHWIHRPRRSLNGVPPIDAAGHAMLRKKLLGVLQFLEECSAAQGDLYDFSRLTRKLGLSDTASADAGSGGSDIAAMNAAELAGLNAADLGDAELEQAYQTATKLDAKEIGTAFLKQLVARPTDTAKPDRFQWYNRLIQNALTQSDLDEAIGYVDEGEKIDCEFNEGRRRNDYELWRGRVHAKRGEPELAQEVFERLIERDPDEPRYRGTAAEAMLTAKENERAMRFAEGGLTLARKKQDRDSEQYFMELSDAAQRQ